jgi:hypothetical protein
MVVITKLYPEITPMHLEINKVYNFIELQEYQDVLMKESKRVLAKVGAPQV